MIDRRKKLRREILLQRDALTVTQRAAAAQLITEQICEHPWFAASDVLLGFVSYGSEIETAGILREALHKGKRVYVPKVEGEDMTFYRIASQGDLQEGYKGIMEPRGDTERFVYQPETAVGVLMLMPGAVFDKERNRMGYGKGFYDRFLSDKEALQLRTMGIGYQCQLVEELPAEEWDIKPCQVICV